MTDGRLEAATFYVRTLQIVERFRMLQPSNQKTHTTMRVYVLLTVVENGLKYEGSQDVKVFQSNYNAHEKLSHDVNEWTEFFKRNYEEEDIHVDYHGMDYAEIYACEWDDCVSLRIMEEEVC